MATEPQDNPRATHRPEEPADSTGLVPTIADASLSAVPEPGLAETVGPGELTINTGVSELAPEPNIFSDEGASVGLAETIALPHESGLPLAQTMGAEALGGKLVPVATDAGGRKTTVPGYEILSELGRGGMGV